MTTKGNFWSYIGAVLVFGAMAQSKDMIQARCAAKGARNYLDTHYIDSGPATVSNDGCRPETVIGCRAKTFRRADVHDQAAAMHALSGLVSHPHRAVRFRAGA
jgi:hypothetical protein